MTSLLSKVGVQIVALKSSVNITTITQTPVQITLEMVKDRIGNLAEKSHITFSVNEFEKKVAERPKFNGRTLIEAQEAICKYFEEERKSIFIDISSMERKNDCLIVKYIKRESNYVIDSRKINEMAKLIRYKLKRLPEHAAIKKVLLEEDSFA